MITRRRLLGSGGLLSAAGLAAGAGLLGSWATRGEAAASDYRALVVLFLQGGNDGHNTLIPTDGAFSDYTLARGNLALAKSSLAALPGSAAGHTFALHPGLAPLAPLYQQGRLAWVANVGPLVEPATAAQVLASAVDVPPFLLSHSDQVAIQQGWTVKDDTSGWAGRALELLPSTLRNPISAVTMSTQRTLVLGRHSRVSFMPRDGARYWGAADLAQPQSANSQSINRMAQWQFANDYQAEYARTFGAAVADSTLFTQALMQAAAPAADFGSGDLADNLRALASVLPVFKAQGIKRQVFLVSWGGFDTHASQLGSATNSQDTQLAAVGKATAAFDQAMQAGGLGDNVVTLMMSDFGRTLRPGSGGGSEHAWGNHWFALGGPVAGGTVHGSFPTLTLGGPDDGDQNKNGRMVPTIATDQVGATLMQWLGLPANLVTEVFPNLVNFNQKTIPLLRA